LRSGMRLSELSCERFVSVSVCPDFGKKLILADCLDKSGQRRTLGMNIERT